MPIITGRFETSHASKYLQQLCKHFAHKIEVEYSAESGRAELPVGIAQMFANSNNLEIRISVQGQDQIEQAQAIIDSHLERFAFRENFKNMVWTSPDAKD